MDEAIYRKYTYDIWIASYLAMTQVDELLAFAFSFSRCNYETNPKVHDLTMRDGLSDDDVLLSSDSGLR